MPENHQPEPIKNSSDQTQASSPENYPSKPKEESRLSLKRKHKLSKTTKIILFAGTWIVLLVFSIGLAFLTKPDPEIVYTNAIIEAYKFSNPDSENITETVDDLDYYGYYNTNPLAFTHISDEEYGSIYAISGLKNKSIEDAINEHIKTTATQLYNNTPIPYYGVNTYITANYFNLLSVHLEQYNNNNLQSFHEGLTFNLNTGQELSFDDLFPNNINLTALLYKSFYDGLSTNIKFEKLSAEARLAHESSYPNPTDCEGDWYCPYPGETYDGIRALIAKYDNQLANIEQFTLDSVENYLSGERKFYLNSYGPAFILSDGTIIEMQLKDNIRYAIYLKNYRSSDSLFENDSLAIQDLFFTETPEVTHLYFNEETDNYLFDYVSFDYLKDLDPSLKQSFYDYLKAKGLNTPVGADKFRHILAVFGELSLDNNILTGCATLKIYETDKSYYKLAYKKAIIDGKINFFSQATAAYLIQPGKAGHYDENRITQLGSDQFYCTVITPSGVTLDDVNDILINPANSSTSWQEYLKQQAYDEACKEFTSKCYTDKEKESHDFIYNVYDRHTIALRLKDNPETGSSFFWQINLSDIPEQYLNPEIFFN